MGLSFRLRIIAVIAASLFSFFALLITGKLISDRIDSQLSAIQGQYMPKIALGPKVETQFDHLSRSFQDAVALQDVDALTTTRTIKRDLLKRLENSVQLIGMREFHRLKEAIDSYYDAAYAVSWRLLMKETGENLVDAIRDMQQKQTHAKTLLKRTTAFDEVQLKHAFRSTENALSDGTRLRLIVSFVCMGLVIVLAIWMGVSGVRSLSQLSNGFERFGKGDLTQPIVVTSQDELGEVATRANRMAESLQQLSAERERTDWIKAGHAGIAQELRGDLSAYDVASRALKFICNHMGAPAAALYYVDSTEMNDNVDTFVLLAAHAHADPVRTIERGIGLVGQAALQQEPMVVTDVPPNYMRIKSGLGEHIPSTLVFLPLVHVGRICGVVEIALFRTWRSIDSELLLPVSQTLTIALEVARGQQAQAALLEELQQQASQLQQQEEELIATNEELRTQQEELQQTNEELATQAQELEQQRHVLEQKNKQLTVARQHLEDKAAELTLVSAYKSQFLTNMSHELRTPLNSMLLLSNLLSENEALNLSDKQVEYAKTIYSAGSDLLALINQILDLARIESGKQKVQIEEVDLLASIEHIRLIFDPLCRDKNLALIIDLADDLPQFIHSDGQKIEQILKNLLGNAIKFTAVGSVALRVTRAGSQTIQFEVTDTGPGISEADRARIFRPFEQVEGAPDRRYGGSGLGLTIALELAKLLGGEIELTSTVGRGSTFTCQLPTRITTSNPRVSNLNLDPIPKPTDIGNKCVCVVNLMADSGDITALGTLIRSVGFTYDVIQPINDSDHLNDINDAVAQLSEKSPRPVGIMVLAPPDFDQTQIAQSLQSYSDLRAIPIHTLINHPLQEDNEIRLFLQHLKDETKSRWIAPLQWHPSDLRLKGHTVLVVDDDMRTVYALSATLRAKGMEVYVADNGKTALEMISNHTNIELIFMDIMMPEMDGYEAMRRIRANPAHQTLPIIALTAKAMKGDREQCIQAGATDYLPKPINPEQLMMLMKTYIAQQSRTE